MQPLIQQFTNNLKPCTSCGKTDLSNPAYSEFFEKRTKGEKVKFIVQVEVETEKASNIDLKAVEAASKGDVLSVNPRPQPQQSVTGSQHAATTRAGVPPRPNG